MSLYKKTPHPSRFARHLLPPVSATPTAFACANRSIPHRRRLFIRFFFCICGRKRKSYQKENAKEDFALCGARQELRVPPSRRRRHTCFAYVSIPRLRKPPQRLDLNFNGKRRAKTFMVVKSNSAKTKALPFAKATLSFYCFCSSAYFFGLSPVSFLKI